MGRTLLRRILFQVAVYLGILLFLMLALRRRDPVWSYLGQRATQAEVEALRTAMGLDRPFLEQYVEFAGQLLRFELPQESWTQPGLTVGDVIASSIGPTLAISLPALVLSTLLSLLVGALAAWHRGRVLDRGLMLLAVLGMSVSFVVFVLFGQYWGGYLLARSLGTELFAVQGYEPGLGPWFHYCLLPVLISVVVAMGADSRFYRAVLAEERQRGYVLAARARGLRPGRILGAHVLPNAMLAVSTRVLISLPLVFLGSLLVETVFNIPGLGRALHQAVVSNDFPLTQGLVAVFAALFLLSVVVTDVLHVWLDPRLRS